jgi:hypothetical protein
MNTQPNTLSGCGMRTDRNAQVSSGGTFLSAGSAGVLSLPGGQQRGPAAEQLEAVSAGITRRDFVTGAAVAFAATAALPSVPANTAKASGRWTIVQQSGATPAEQTAAEELASFLRLSTGGRFEIRAVAVGVPPEKAIIVGPGPVAQALFPDEALHRLQPEEFVMRSRKGRLLLAGGRPRGTLYAVYQFLQRFQGVRWWSPHATSVPRRGAFQIPDLNEHGQPAFQYRYPWWFDGVYSPQWEVRNGVNGGVFGYYIPGRLGGGVKYAHPPGFASTFYNLVPPQKYFADHPDWYSLINGKRTWVNGQLCLSNPALRRFVVERVKQLLREPQNANASIISVSQMDNGWSSECKCRRCLATDKAHGGPSGSLLTFVNYVAERIEPEFPQIAVDTLAYIYTLTPPTNLRARSNVIVRVCLSPTHQGGHGPNQLQPINPDSPYFRRVVDGWLRICRRVYIWDYVTDFHNYLVPLPNWFTLGPNLRLFQRCGVQGVFSEGACWGVGPNNGAGAEMGELRSWLTAQLLWNPQQDDRALIREFLEGYYGRAPARTIYRYLELMHKASRGFCLATGQGRYIDSPQTAFFTFPTLARAERLWQAAEKAAGSDPEKLERVRMGHLAVRYVFLCEWARLQAECRRQKAIWPLPASRRAVAAQFAKVCQGVPGKPWTAVRELNEAGFTVAAFLKELGKKAE